MSVKTFIAAMSLKVKIIIACSAAFVISGAVAAGIILTKEDTYRVLKVFEMTGSSVITREGTGDIDAYIGMNLESGDTVTVSSGSTLRLALDSDKYLMLDSDTVLELIASGTAADSRTAINLKQGTILNEITTPLSANSSYEVSAPKATMAVRGTSFTVSVDKDNDGGYTIRENTLNGKVEVTLLDSNGNPTQKTVLVGADKGVTIRTEPDESSGNPAEKDGISRFVMEDENGNIFELGEGDDPIHEIFYNMLSAKVKENALRSNDEHLMELDELIVRKLRGELNESNTEEDSEDTAPAGTAPVTESVTEPETEPEQESAPAEATAPAETAAPEAAMEAPQSVVTNAPVSAESQPETVPETIPETVPEAAPETSAETAPATSAKTSASRVATVPTESKPDSTSAKTTAKTTANSSGTSVSTVTAPSNTGTAPSDTGTTPPYTGTAPSDTGTTPSDTGTTPSDTGTTPSETGTTAPTSESTADTSATEPEKTVYTVTFMYNGEIYSTELVEEGSKIGNIPEPPARTGYTGKWYFGNKEFTYNTPVISDMTVNAVYTAKTYTVTFTADADTAYSTSLEAKYGETVTAPDVPEKTGYTGKWYVGDEEFTSAYVITSDITVTAKYTAKAYTVTFTANADTAYSSSLEAKYGETVIAPDVPAKTGYTGKWYVGDEEFTSAYVITSDITVTAKYTAKTYTVTFTANADTAYTNSFEVRYGETVTAPDVPEKTGYTGKWYVGDEEFISAYVITSDITVTAKYTAKTYTVTFTANADTAYSTSLEAKYGETVTAPDVPEKTGYTGKWYVGDAEFTSAYVITSDITVTAKYTVNTYTVTFIADNKVLTSVKAEYNTSIKEYVPAVPEKEGYSTDGKWYFENDAEFDPAMLITENITVTAVYTLMEFTVTYVPSYNNSDVLSTETVSYGAVPSGYTPTTVIDTDNDGSYDYYLWGWDKVKAELTAVTDNKTVIVPYVDYDDVHEIRVVNEGAVIYSGLYINGDTYVLPTPENIPEGYQFMGWGIVYSGEDFATGNKVGTPASEPGYSSVDTFTLTAAGAEVTLNSPIGILNNTEYRAIYEKLEFTLTIQYMSGTSEERTVQYGDKLDGYVSTDGTNAWTVNGTAVDISTYEIKSNITVIETSATDTLSLDDALTLDGYIPIADDTDTTITENEETVSETGMPETTDTSPSDTSDITPEQPVTEPQTEVIPDETETDPPTDETV